MKKSILIAAAVVVLLIVAGVHWFYMDRGRWTTAPVYTDLGRQVEGNDLASTFDPAVVLRFSPEYRYAGGQKFVLYGSADTEQHFFVETTEDDKLKSVYWVQFEAYLPDNDYTYDYDDSPLRVSLGDYEFKTDTASGEFDPDRKRKRGTDGAMARQLLARQGYVLPRNFAYARLVYLTDETRRKELMIIFIDDLDAYGASAADLAEGGPAESRWPGIEQQHIGRIMQTLDVFPNAD